MEVEKCEMQGDVACLDIAPVPAGRERSRFLAVGTCDNLIRIMSLDPNDCMQMLSMQSVFLSLVSLQFLKVQASTRGEDGAGHHANLFLNAGLQNGMLCRTVVDMVTGRLSDISSRFLGLKAPKLFSITIRGQHAVLCLSSRPWLGYIYQGQFLLTPLTSNTLEFAASFSSDQCAEGVIAVAAESLKRKVLVIIESDQRALTAEEREAARKECLRTGKDENGNVEMENAHEDDDSQLSDEQYGYPKLEKAKWVSCIRVLDPRTGHTIGTAKSLQFSSNRSFDAAYIHIYQFVDGEKLELLHKTQVDDGVIDGDLCEQFPTLPIDMQRKIADELDNSPVEILKKLEEIRNIII
uniref:RSE1/DDB1/CPSF1 second beta-propeller domain-containing protein n=1 Tax=Chenopodium quinoa TaxID=63459 RepID=A0A803KTF8_CHEQI